MSNEAFAALGFVIAWVLVATEMHRARSELHEVRMEMIRLRHEIRVGQLEGRVAFEPAADAIDECERGQGG